MALMVTEGFLKDLRMKKMYKVYLYTGEYFHGSAGWPLVRKGASKYLASDADNMEIQVTEKGKPYFADGKIQFSISHSERLWACVYGPGSCGLDVQFHKKANFRRISMRHFSREEALYVERGGMEAFFQIWTRREALGKLTGKGFFDNMPSFVQDGRLEDEVIYQGKKVYIDQVQVPEGFTGALCRYDREDFTVEYL